MSYEAPQQIEAEKPKAVEKANYEDVLEEARERFTHAQQVDRQNRDNQKADTKFVFTPGEQWPAEVRAQRKEWKEVCLEFNQLKQFVAQVVNDMRQKRPGIRVHAASGDASKETAEILQGMIRAIEYQSNADAAYENGFLGAVVGGRGWWRVCSEYVGKLGFNQRLAIKPIADPLTVYADLDYQEPDGSDRQWVFVVETCPKKEFARRWPKADPVNWDGVETSWVVDSDNIYIADYYRRVCTKRAYVRMSDGAEGWKDEMPTPPEGTTIALERDVETWKVEWFKVAGGQQVLDKYDWPGSIIPVVCAVGEEVMLDGKRVYQGLTRHARDAQSMLNFGMTQQAILLSLTPRAPFIGSARAIAGYENLWRDANTKNLGVLPFNDIDEQGVINKPERTPPVQPEAGWINWNQTMLGMVKSTIGMYENNLGQRGQEDSGTAIRQKESQGDNATFNYGDNLGRAIALTGRICTETMPVFYDTHQIVQTIGMDETRKAVTINQPGATADPVTGALTAINHNDITVGDYAVTVEAGPSYKTKRQETSAALMSFVKAFPPAAAVAGDLIVKAIEVPDADVLAERLKLTLPPAVQQAEAAKAKGGKAPDPQAMAEIQKLQQQLQLATDTMGKMHEKVQELQSGAQQKMQAAQLDAQARVQIADQESKAAIAKAQADANATFHIEQLKAEKSIERAHIESATAIEKARIERMTKLEIEAMGDKTKIQVAGMDNDTKLEIAHIEPAAPEKVD